MTKIIDNPDRLISAFVSSFGEQNRDIIERVFSQYISNVAIAVTAEDIIEQVIAWANAHENFHPAWIEPEDEDRDRYRFISHHLKKLLNIPLIIDEVDRKGSLSDGYGSTIDEVLKRMYGDRRLLELALDAANQYDLYLENNNA
jgi:hypothetical protein